MTERAYFITPVALPEQQKYSSFRKPYVLKFAYFCLTKYKSENEYYSIAGILMLSRMKLSLLKSCYE